MPNEVDVGESDVANADPAAPRRAIALGASAGGVEALTGIMRELPASFAAPILVVLHVPATAVSRLPEILDRAGALPAAHAEHGELPSPGRVYVAPPGRHLIVIDGRLVLIEGPHENGLRPALDPLFRSAAAWYGEGLLAAVLSGTLDDGTAGIATVRARGGIAVAQEPSEAFAPGMPNSAIENVPVDFVLPTREIAGLMRAFVAGEIHRSTSPIESVTGTSEPIDLVCPECGGVLRKFPENGITRFHCRVGHTYSPDALFASQTDRLEAALWSSIRSLEETASLARRLADAARERGSPLTARRYEERERYAAEQADVVRSAILALGPVEPTPPAGEPPPLAVESAEDRAAVG